MASVLLFHEVTDRHWFDNLIGWLKHRYQLVPIGSLRASRGARDQPCHITVDDGHRSFYDVIFPVLKKHGVCASLFVSPKICRDRDNFWFQEIQGYDNRILRTCSAEVIGTTATVLEGFSPACIFKAMRSDQMEEVIRRYRARTSAPRKGPQNVSVEELQEMADSGLVSVGAHTMTHPILTNERNSSCEYEIEASVNELRTLLDRDVKYFAYPNGIANLDFGPREERVVRSCGIEMAFSTEMRHHFPDDNPLRIPRLAISDQEGMRSIRTKLLFGSVWNRAKELTGVGERSTRQRLGNILDVVRSDARLVVDAE